MPKALERKLKIKAWKLFGDNKKRRDKYVYGTMNKLGLMPKKKRG